MHAILVLFLNALRLVPFSIWEHMNMEIKIGQSGGIS